MGMLTQGPSEWIFYGVNYGHHIGLFPKKRPNCKQLIKREVDSMMETLHGGSLLTSGETVEDNLITQKLGIKESKWLVIHKHCIKNINQIDQVVGNQLLCVYVLNWYVE